MQTAFLASIKQFAGNFNLPVGGIRRVIIICLLFFSGIGSGFLTESQTIYASDQDSVEKEGTLHLEKCYTEWEKEVFQYQHIVLPEMLFKNGSELMNEYLNRGNTVFLDLLPGPLRGNFGNAIVFRKIREVGDARLIIISFPEPRRSPQCYHVALAVTPSSSRFFTLEKCNPESPFSALAYFGEWTSDGKHKSIGSSVNHESADFEQVILNIISLEQKER